MVFSNFRSYLLDSYRTARRFLAPSEEYRLHVRKDGNVVRLPYSVSVISPANW